jgi:hypothetical protein
VHTCAEVTHSCVEGLLPGAPSLSLGSDEEGTWCRSSEVMWCGSSEEGRVVVNPARRARGDGLSLGSDKEGVWCTSSEEVTWCGSGEEGMWW